MRVLGNGLVVAALVGGVGRLGEGPRVGGARVVVGGGGLANDGVLRGVALLLQEDPRDGVL